MVSFCRSIGRQLKTPAAFRVTCSVATPRQANTINNRGLFCPNLKGADIP